MGRTDGYISSTGENSRTKAATRIRTWAGTVVFLVAVVAVGSYYYWAVRMTGSQFQWGQDLGGYYDYLGRAFARGHLYLPVEPAPQLLAAKNPWAPGELEQFKLFDAVLFNRRYYLYHGAGPALMLFAPWRLVTAHDLPENFALFLLCFGGFLFSAGALLALLELACARPTALTLGVMVLALGICQAVPYLLNRVFVYEIAIGGGYFCLSGAVFFLARAFLSHRAAYWLAASGCMFGLAIACRPHLGAAGLIALGVLIVSRTRPRELASFSVPLVLVGTAIMAYNYARFGNPFEFGIRYLLTSENQQRIRLSGAYLPPGLYFLLFCSPAFSAVFPWVHQVFRLPFNSLGYSFPAGYFIEPTIGALYLAPFAVAAAFVPRVRQVGPSGVRMLLWVLAASSGAVLLFLAATGFTTQRYLVDFLPAAVLGAVAGFGIRITRSSGARRIALAAVFCVLAFWGLVANLALGISGPYDDLLKNRPAGYMRIARWFSPIERFRPILNPTVIVDLRVEFVPHEDGFREPLLTMGSHTYRHFLHVTHVPGKLRITSQSDASAVAYDLAWLDNRTADIRVKYSPESGRLVTAINGQEVISHDIKQLLTAPAEVTPGENRVDPNLTGARFTGRMQVVEKTVRQQPGS